MSFQEILQPDSDHPPGPAVFFLEETETHQYSNCYNV
jgi:hypothetical protein